MIHLRNNTLPWIVIAALLLAWLGLQPPRQDQHELVWANIGEPSHFNLGFGGWWLDYVAQPLFFALLCVWLWRLVLLLKSIAGLDFQFVPTHPDRAGGLGFLEKLPKAFGLFAFALSAAVASRLAHEVVYHGMHVLSLKAEVGVFLILLVVLRLAPLIVFIPKLVAAKKQALLDYGALVGEHGRLVHRRWILGESLEAPSLLEASEIGPVADAVALYEAVANMRAAPHRQVGGARRGPARRDPAAGIVRDRGSHQGIADENIGQLGIAACMAGRDFQVNKSTWRLDSLHPTAGSERRHRVEGA